MEFENCAAFHVIVRHEKPPSSESRTSEFLVVVKKDRVGSSHKDELEVKDVTIGSNKKLKRKAYNEEAMSAVVRFMPSPKASSPVCTEIEAEEIEGRIPSRPPDFEGAAVAVWKL